MSRRLAIADARTEYLRARLALLDAVQRNCPGPHTVEQHRDDGEPPWCHACGYTTTGIPINAGKERPAR